MPSWQRTRSASTSPRVMDWLVAREPLVHYPPGDVRQALDHLSFSLLEQQVADRFARGQGIQGDCSQTVQWLCRLAGLADPCGLGYQRAGYTGNLLEHLPHYSDPAAAEVGAIAVLGPWPPLNTGRRFGCSRSRTCRRGRPAGATLAGMALLSFVSEGVARITGELRGGGGAAGDVLTQQADGSYAPAPNGGSSPVLKAEVTLTSAQIKAIFETPVTLVECPSGKWVAPVAVFVTYHAGATPYMSGGGGFGVGVAAQPTLLASLSDTGFLDQATDQIQFQGYVNAGAVMPASDWDGEDVLISGQTADSTDGDGTVTFTALYILVDA